MVVKEKYYEVITRNKKLEKYEPGFSKRLIESAHENINPTS
jgi:hypothetical protein